LIDSKNIFISYATEDLALAELFKVLLDGLNNVMNSTRVVTWMSANSIGLGEYWRQVVVEKVSHSTNMVVLLSEHYLDKISNPSYKPGTIGYELQQGIRRNEFLAYSGHRYLIPINLYGDLHGDRVRRKIHDTPELKWLGEIQHIDFLVKASGHTKRKAMVNLWAMMKIIEHMGISKDEYPLAVLGTILVEANNHPGGKGSDEMFIDFMKAVTGKVPSEVIFAGEKVLRLTDRRGITYVLKRLDDLFPKALRGRL
jgi:hypothetical protein